MSNVINCQSCGATNQLSEGEDFKCCNFCGSIIEKHDAEKKTISDTIDFIDELNHAKNLLNESIIYGEIEKLIFKKAFGLFVSLYNKNPSNNIILNFIQMFSDRISYINQENLIFLTSLCQTFDIRDKLNC